MTNDELNYYIKHYIEKDKTGNRKQTDKDSQHERGRFGGLFCCKKIGKR